MTRSLVLASSALLSCMGALAPVGVLTAHAAPPIDTPQGCSAESYVTAQVYGTPTYQAWGPAAGTYNASSATKTLSYALNTTATLSSTISAGASIGLKFGIASIEGTTNYSVQESVSAGRTVNDTLSIPAYSKGYDQPKVERRTFSIIRHTINNRCDERTQALGVVNAITAAPFFSSCVVKGATGTCAPRP